MISVLCFFQRKFSENHTDEMLFCRESKDVDDDDIPEAKVSKKGQMQVKEEPITPSKSAAATSATRLTRASERSARQGMF